MRGRWVILGLVLFVAADAVLVGLSFRHVAARPTAEGVVPVAGSSPVARPSPGSATGPAVASADPSPTAPDGEAPVAFLALGDDGSLLRTSRGDCRQSGEPTVTVSPGPGGSAVVRRVPELREVVAVRVATRRDLTVVGLDRGCRPATHTSTDGGRTWTRRSGDTGSWHLAADREIASVTAPGGTRSTPCVPVSLSAVDASVARVLCGSGQVLGTQDGGETWVALGRLEGAVDIRFTSPGAGVGLARQGGCPAAVLRTSDGGTTWKRLVCLPGRTPRAIGAQGGLVAAQVGEQLYSSSDAGVTWSDGT